jgi:hypothetical protein
VTKPFDAGLNALIDAHLADWAAYLAARLGLPPGPAEPLDTDLSATLQADRLFRMNGPVPYALHLELESTGRLGIPEELLRYNVSARKTTGLPVRTVVLMLRPKATATDLTGQLDLPDAAGGVYLTFRYTVVRLWQEPFEPLLTAGLGLAPLALLTNEAAADLPAAVARFHARLQEEAVPANVEKDLLFFTAGLGGLRYERDLIERLVMGGRGIIEETPLYRRAKAEGVCLAVLAAGAGRLGPAPAAVVSALQAITDEARLLRMLERIPSASGWDDLLATP